MSGPDTGTRSDSVKTLGIRLKSDLHARLSLVAQLRGKSINDEVEEAIDRHLAAITSDPVWASKAEALLAEIDREAAARRSAFMGLFGDGPVDEPIVADGEPTLTDDASAPPAASKPRRTSSR